MQSFYQNQIVLLSEILPSQVRPSSFRSWTDHHLESFPEKIAQKLLKSKRFVTWHPERPNACIIFRTLQEIAAELIFKIHPRGHPFDPTLNNCMYLDRSGSKLKDFFCIEFKIECFYQIRDVIMRMFHMRPRKSWHWILLKGRPRTEQGREDVQRPCAGRFWRS